MNKYIRSTGLYAFLFPASLKAPGQTAAEKIEQLKPEFITGKGVWKSIWNYSLCFSLQVLCCYG